jgi:FkbM family methyltransferase
MKLPAFLSETPLTVLDIGARGGLDQRWNSFLDSIHAVLAEPDPEEAARLERALKAQGLRDVRVIPKALGSRQGAATLYLTRNPECSSLYRPNEAWLERFPDVDRFRVVRELPIELDTLDAQIAARGWAGQPCDFIKIDVQGYELEVLRGGEQALGACLFVEAEVAFHPIYEGQPLFPEIEQHLTSRGFQLLDLERIFWRRRDVPREINSRNQVIWANVLYYRDPLALASLDRATAIRALKVFLAHHLFDLAAELLAFAVARQHFTAAEHESVLEWMRHASLFRSGLWRWLHGLPLFPGKRRVERLAGLFAHGLGLKYGEGVVVDAESWNRRWRW